MGCDEFNCQTVVFSAGEENLAGSTVLSKWIPKNRVQEIYLDTNSHPKENLNSDEEEPRLNSGKVVHPAPCRPMTYKEKLHRGTHQNYTNKNGYNCSKPPTPDVLKLTIIMNW
jgi:hypothetical protein